MGANRFRFVRFLLASKGNTNVGQIILPARVSRNVEFGELRMALRLTIYVYQPQSNDR